MSNFRRAIHLNSLLLLPAPPACYKQYCTPTANQVTLASRRVWHACGGAVPRCGPALRAPAAVLLIVCPGHRVCLPLPSLPQIQNMASMFANHEMEIGEKGQPVAAALQPLAAASLGRQPSLPPTRLVLCSCLFLCRSYHFLGVCHRYTGNPRLVSTHAHINLRLLCSLQHELAHTTVASCSHACRRLPPPPAAAACRRCHAVPVAPPLNARPGPVLYTLTAGWLFSSPCSTPSTRTRRLSPEAPQSSVAGSVLPPTPACACRWCASSTPACSVPCPAKK
jgi:hypothetical protein